jgi:hypothetical protein
MTEQMVGQPGDCNPNPVSVFAVSRSSIAVLTPRTYFKPSWTRPAARPAPPEAHRPGRISNDSTDKNSRSNPTTDVSSSDVGGVACVEVLGRLGHPSASKPRFGEPFRGKQPFEPVPLCLSCTGSEETWEIAASAQHG